MYYRIKKYYRYTEIVVVEAGSRKEALSLSDGVGGDPEYESLYDAHVLEESEEPIEK